MKIHHTTSSTALLNKVPEVAVAFWVIKIMTTTVGETVADYLAVNAGLGQATTRWAMLIMLIGTLVAQMRTTRCQPILYWTTVVLVSVVAVSYTHLTLPTNREV